MKVLLLGSGGREHAIAVSLVASDLVEKLYVAPGNGGTAAIAENIELAIDQPDAVLQAARDLEVELVVIGPDLPLALGVANRLRGAGFAVFGPDAEAGRLESSKQFAKEFMDRHGLPTAAWDSFTDQQAALEYLATHPAPIVIKADGLAAGKGVVVAASDEEARAAVQDCFSGRFGTAGSTVLIEACLDGPECSCLIFTDGKRVLPMPLAQDHKRVGEGDTGPNTGGMGVYSPVPIVSAADEAEMYAIMARTVDGLNAEQLDYRGVIYAGFMLTSEGPKLLEFNARFGDPETQVLLPRLQSDLAELMLAVAAGDISGLKLSWSDQAAFSVVLASGGYPADYETGKLITGTEECAAIPDIHLFHAGTKLDKQGRLLTSGGRVLNVTALGADLQEAHDRAYAALQHINFDGCYYRRDIGLKACAQ